MKKLFTMATILLLLTILIMGCSTDEIKEAFPNSGNADTSGLTLEEQNALRAAKRYLDVTAFSRSGLIDQLEFEGYSTEASTKAVDSLNVDWNEQAALKAKQYLKSMPFSRSELIDQLEYEGFTTEEAEYGVKAVGY